MYENYRDATEADLERAKTEMDPASIKETIIDGHQGIEGLITGPKTRYIMVVLKGNKLFSVSTIPPTKENKALTQQIISTFNFE